MEEKKPPVTARLGLLLQNPDLLNMNVDYQSVREAFLEMGNQLDEVKKNVNIFAQAESTYLKVNDLTEINEKMGMISEQVDRNSKDFSTELREIRAYFEFQIKEIKAKLESTVTQVITEISRPPSITPTPATSNDTPIPVTVPDPMLRADLELLKERFDSLIASLSQPGLEGEMEDEEEEDDNGEHDSNQAVTPPNSNPETPLETPHSDKDDEEKDTVTDLPMSTPLELGSNSYTTSSPTLTPNHQLPVGRSSAVKKVLEIRLEDFRVQIEGVKAQLRTIDEKLKPLVTNVPTIRSDVEQLNTDLIKLRAEHLILKSDVERMNDKNADSVVDFMKELRERTAAVEAPPMPDLEKPMLAMRHQFMQQFAKMETAFNEQLRKMRAEISALKTSNAELRNLPPPSPPNEQEEEVKITQEFAGEEPAEKALLREMFEKAEEDKKRKEEELERFRKEAEAQAAAAAAKAQEEREKLIALISKEQETPRAESVVTPEGPREYASIEIQTDLDSSSYVQFHTSTNCTLPNQLVVSVIAEAAPSEKIASMPPTVRSVHSEHDQNKEETIEPENEEKPASPTNEPEDEPKPQPEPEPVIIERELTPQEVSDHEEEEDKEITKYDPPEMEIKPTLSFEYARFASEDDSNYREAITDMKSNIQRHQEVLEQLYDQLNEDKESEERQPRVSYPAFKDVESRCKNNSLLISKIENELENLKTDVSSIPKQASTPPSQSIMIQSQPNPNQPIINRQIILTPVVFSPLYVASPNLSIIRPKNKPQNKPVKPKKSPKEAKVETKEVKQEPAKSDSPKKVIKKQSPSPKPQQQNQQQIQQQQQQRQAEEEDINDILSLLEKPSEETTEEGKVVTIEQTDETVIVKKFVKKAIRARSSTTVASKPKIDLTKKEKKEEPPKEPEEPPKQEQKEEKPKEEEEGNKEENENFDDFMNKDFFETPKEEEDKHEEEVKEPEHHEEEEKKEPPPSEEEEEEENSEVDEPSPKHPEEEAVTEPSVVEEEEEEDQFEMINDKFVKIDDTISNHNEQIKILRGAVVELRTNMQILKSENKDQHMLPMVDIVDEKQEEKIITQVDDNAIRALRRRFDAQTRDFEDEIYKLQKDLLEIKQSISKLPTGVTERIIQVQVPTPQASKPAVPILVADDIKNTMKSEPQEVTDVIKTENVMKITPLNIASLDDLDKPTKYPIIDAPLPPEPSSAPRQKFTKSKEIKPDIKNINTQPSTPKGNHKKPLPELQSVPPAPPAPSPDTNYRPIFHNIVKQNIQELRVLNATDEIEEHILNLIIDVRTQLQLQVDNQGKRLTDIESKIPYFVEKDYVAKFFSKMRTTINDLNDSVVQMRQSMPERVTKDELQNVATDIYRSLTKEQETIGGTTSYRCLLCGRPKTSISGMITDYNVADSLGNPTSATITQSPGANTRGTMIYGPDKQLYRGKGNLGKTTMVAPSTSESKKRLPSLDHVK